MEPELKQGPNTLQARWMILGTGVTLLAWGCNGVERAQVQVSFAGLSQTEVLVPGVVMVLAGLSTIGLALWVYVGKLDLASVSLTTLNRYSLRHRARLIFDRAHIVFGGIGKAFSPTGIRRLAGAASWPTVLVVPWVLLTLSFGLSGFAYYATSKL